MKPDQTKEKYEGLWNGQNVEFNREWGGYRFSDEECEHLLAGNALRLNGLVSKKTGKTYGVIGRLARCVFMNRNYIGFSPETFLHPEKKDEAVLDVMAQPQTLSVV